MNEILPKFVCVKSNSSSDNAIRKNEIQNNAKNACNVIKLSPIESQTETYKKTELLNSSVASFMITSSQHNFHHTPKIEFTNQENELKEDEESDLNKTLTDDDVTVNSILTVSNIHAAQNSQNNEIAHKNKIEEDNDLYYSDREDLIMSSEELIMNDEKEDLKNDKMDNFNLGRWQPEEHHKFIKAMYMYGNEWKKVQEFIGSRSSTQARSHAQKFFIRLKKRFSCENNLNDQESLKKKSEKILIWIKESIPNDTIDNNLRENEKDENSNKFCKVIMNLMSGQIEAKGRKRRHKPKTNLSEAYQFEEKNMNYNSYGMSRRESASGVQKMIKDSNNPYNLANANNNSSSFFKDDFQCNNNFRMHKKIKIPLMIEDNEMGVNSGNDSNENYSENFRGQSDITQENRIFIIFKDVKRMELKIKNKSKMIPSNFSQALNSSYKPQDQDYVEEIVKKSKINNTSNVINKQILNPKHRHYINIVNINIDNNNGAANPNSNNIKGNHINSSSNSNMNLNVNRDQNAFNNINGLLNKEESINIKLDTINNNNTLGSSNTINSFNSNPNNFNSHLMNSFNNFNNNSNNANCSNSKNSIQISENDVVKNLMQQKVLYQILMHNQARSQINLLNSLNSNSFNNLACNTGNNYNMPPFGSTAPTNSYDNLNMTNPGISGINSNYQFPQYNNQYQTLNSCNSIFEGDSCSKVNNNIFDINFEEESSLFKLYGREDDYKSFVNTVNENNQIIKNEDPVKSECNIDFDLDQYFKSD